MCCSAMKPSEMTSQETSEVCWQPWSCSSEAKPVSYNEVCDWFFSKQELSPPHGIPTTRNLRTEGPPCLPIVGCVPFLPSKYLHLRMEQWLKQYGSVVGVMLGSQPAVFICGPSEVREVMKREEFQGRPENANFRQDNFNRKLGIFFSDGPFWVEQRRFTLHHLRDLGFGKSIMEALISEEVEDVIKELRQCEVLQNVIREHDKTFKENDLRDFIDVYLKEMKNQSENENSTFSEDGLIVTCFDLFAAGAESVSNTLSFSLLYSVLYPEIQIRVQHLLDDVVGRNRCPCLADRSRLQYVEAVLTEVMRINTVAPVAPAHRVTQDTTLNGYNIPKNTTVIASLWSLLHDKEHWGDPQAFRPERFLDKYGNFVKDEWMTPFGIGKRTCLGEMMARNILFIFYTSLLQEFSFSLPAGDPQPTTLCLPGITTAPQPFRVKLTRRY